MKLKPSYVLNNYIIMSVIIDDNVSASLDEKLGENIWWKPEIDKKVL